MESAEPPRTFVSIFIMRKICILAVLTLSGLRAQEPTFEVASVKPSQSLREGSSIRNQPGRFETSNTTLRQLIRYALGIQDFQIVGGPQWLNVARFDIKATNAQADPPVIGAADLKGNALRIARIRARLRQLLEERFQLQLKQEEREMPIYALTVEKSGPKTTPVKDPLGNVNMNQGAAGATMNAKGATMGRLCEVLSGLVERPVVDETGLTGYFDIDLKYSLDMATPEAGAAPKDSAYPSLFTAIREQLGLRLVGKKGNAAVWVVVRAEKPEEN
jgi:uncharacterized protein (TIGR03435 family)